MSIFDKDSFPTQQEPTPESFENATHFIPEDFPIDIDLTQPDSLVNELSEEITTVEGAKRIAEIHTQQRDISLFYFQVPDYDPMVMVYDPKRPYWCHTIGLGEDFDASDDGEEGKCIITVDMNGRVLVHGHETNPEQYQISTHEIKHERPLIFEDFPENFPDDPEL